MQQTGGVQYKFSKFQTLSTVMLNILPLLHRLPVASFKRRVSLARCRRIHFSRMSANPAPMCPKFIPIEVGDIHSRSKIDGISATVGKVGLGRTIMLENYGPIRMKYAKNMCVAGTNKLCSCLRLCWTGIRFSLVSYNILAQVYIRSSLFPHSPTPCLRLKNRSEAILTILKNLNADFLCLQELDNDDFYKENMETDGYSSLYIQRTGQKRDGCGIFYKHNRAEFLVENRIEYNDLVSSIQDGSSCGDEQCNMLAKGNNDADSKNGSSVKKESSRDHGDLNDPYVRLKRDCVGIMAAFRLKGPFDHVVIVATTHLYWDPELADVKLAQAKYLSLRLAEFKTQISDKFDCVPSAIVAGDFNSVPGDKVYQYLTSRCPTSAPLMDCMEELPIPLCSVYAFTRGEPLFTNCTPDFTDTLDYIFFSPFDCIKPVSILELPDSDSPDVVGCLPNYYHPSDHLPIGAEFEVTRD